MRLEARLSYALIGLVQDTGYAGGLDFFRAVALEYAVCLLFGVALVAPRGAHIAAAAPLTGGRRACFSRGTAHDNKYIHPLSALGALHLGHSGGVLSLVTAAQNCHRVLRQRL